MHHWYLVTHDAYFRMAQGILCYVVFRFLFLALR
jgi:hypothetical protein